MGLVRTLIDCEEQHSGPSLPAQLRNLYDGDLHLPPASAEMPYVIGNFVSTLDGVVSYKIKGHSDGSAISGSDPTDRFIMGLLRASADAVMVGARTVYDAGPKALWIPDSIYPDAKDLYTEYRLNALHKPKYPLVVIVSGSGRLDLQRAVFRTPEAGVLIVTAAAGQKELIGAGAANLPSVRIKALEEDMGGEIGPREILRCLASEFGVTTLLHEGGPKLFGQFLKAGLVNELFLTVSPQIAGRSSQSSRPAVMEEAEFLPETAPWFRLLSVKQKSEYLYLRYRCTGPRTAASLALAG